MIFHNYIFYYFIILLDLIIINIIMSNTDNNNVNVDNVNVDAVISKINPDDVKPMSKADMVCAPGLKFEAGSCMRLKVAIEMAKAYNQTVQDENKIPLSTTMETINPQKYKAYLIQQLTERNKNQCSTQKCWGTLDFVKYMDKELFTEYKKYTMRPNTLPGGRFTWLSTFDINDVMAQYEMKYKNFKFFGAMPMDFADLDYYEINHVDYKKLYDSGITKLGIIFNLDNHNQAGSHWVSYYCDLAKGCIFYFDSFAVKPERRVRALMRKQVRFMQSLGKNINDIKCDYNKVQHQKGSSECGVYSLRFILKMLSGEDFYELCNDPISDKRINKCRSVYFDKYTKQKER
jgi:hypothetical protein